MGLADLTNSNDQWTQIIESMTRLQSNTSVEAEFARTFRGAFLDSRELAFAQKAANEPAGTFADNDIAQRLRYIAQTMPYYKTIGSSRQIYYTQWGTFDTHANQRYTGVVTGNADQDGQLAQLAAALVAFDKSMLAAGMSNDVAVLVTSEFSRTLDPASGFGSDHAWGGHWMVMGGRVNGGACMARNSLLWSWEGLTMCMNKKRLLVASNFQRSSGCRFVNLAWTAC